MPALFATLLILASAQIANDIPAVQAKFATAPVSTDADDPAIWVNHADPSKSVIYGTDKTKAPEGGLYAFDLSGQVLQHIPHLDRPNNVDVEYGLSVDNAKADIVVATERNQRRLRVFQIDSKDGHLRDISGETEVFKGDAGEDGAPMGIGLYHRPTDHAIFAIVTPKAGPKTGHLAQYRLSFNPSTRRVDAKLVRRFGDYSGVKETESVYIDDEAGNVYYSDETVGTRKYAADPDAPNANEERGFFNRTGTKGDHEGIALIDSGRGTGFLVCTDQIAGNSIYRVFRREGSNEFVGAFSGGADETDGLDIESRPLGPKFPRGIVVAMNSGPKNFLVYDLGDVLKAIKK